jgi:hypothetical protein
VSEHLVLLIKFNVTAHHDNGLPHQEKKKSTEYRENQDSGAKEADPLGKTEIMGIELSDENIYQRIIVTGSVF